MISGITNWGIYVELSNTIEGLVHVANMYDDHYDYYEDRYEMVGEHTGKTYKLGETVYVRVIDADCLTRTIDFEMEMCIRDRCGTCEDSTDLWVRLYDMRHSRCPVLLQPPDLLRRILINGPDFPRRSYCR